MPNRIIIQLFAYLILSITAYSQQYPFVHYTPKDGLANSRVRKAFQDSRGRMYFLTFGGLSVYDGARFKNYTTQDGLMGDMINDILEVGPDSFLVATNSYGLNTLIDGRIGVWSPKKFIPIINQLFKDDDGTIYVTTDNGLHKLQTGHVVKLATAWSGSNEPVLYTGEMVSSKDYLVFSHNDLRSNTGLFLYNKKTNTITDALPDLKMGDIAKGPDGVIWVSSYNRTFILDTVALSQGKLKLQSPYQYIHNPDYYNKCSFVFNRQHELLILTGDRGIDILDKKGVSLNIPSPGINTINPVSAFIDREDVLWICFDGNGVYKLSNTKLLLRKSLLPGYNSDIYAIFPMANDSTWFMMSNSEWILNHNGENSSFKVPPIENLSLLIHNNNHLYAVSARTLYKISFSRGNSKQLHFKPILSLPDTSAFGGRSVIDPWGNIILHERNHMLAINNNDKLIGSTPVMFYDLVEGMYIDRRQQLWVVSRGEGLRIYSLHPGRDTGYFKLEHRFYKELGGASPRCMLVDKYDNLWIGTRYHGLLCFRLKRNVLHKIHHFKTHNGLTDNFVTSLTSDLDGNIIVGTQTGLDRLNRSTDGNYRPENITKSNNVFTYINYVWTDRQNNTFAHTNTNDILQVKPASESSSTPEPGLLIEEVKVNGELLKFIGSSPRLQYFQRNINFSVAAPTFIDEKQVQYSYRLAGSGNSDWSEPRTNPDISLLNLSPGKYTFEVKALFPSTTYSPQQISYSFEILPPWWQSWWFRISMAALVITAVVYVIRFYYLRKLEKEKTLLERQQVIEKERTRIATDMHDDLGAGLSRIKFLSETIGIKKQMQQPIEEDISSIRQYSHEMIDKMGEIVWALNEKNDSLSDLLSYTRSYAVEYLSQNGIRCTVKAPDNFPSVFVSGEYRRNIYLVVKEALHNIVKHAQAQQVTITIKIAEELSISIADDGRGFTEEDIRPYSNGLINMKKRMNDIGGKLEIDHENGTTVLLRSPVPSGMRDDR